MPTSVCVFDVTTPVACRRSGPLSASLVYFGLTVFVQMFPVAKVNFVPGVLSRGPPSLYFVSLFFPLVWGRLDFSDSPLRILHQLPGITDVYVSDV